MKTAAGAHSPGALLTGKRSAPDQYSPDCQFCLGPRFLLIYLSGLLETANLTLSSGIKLTLSASLKPTLISFISTGIKTENKDDLFT